MDESEVTEEGKVKQEYEAVCSKLNMDQASMEAAWTSYTDTRDYYTLEVSGRRERLQGGGAIHCTKLMVCF